MGGRIFAYVNVPAILQNILPSRVPIQATDALARGATHDHINVTFNRELVLLRRVLLHNILICRTLQHLPNTTLCVVSALTSALFEWLCYCSRRSWLACINLLCHSCAFEPEIG